MRFQKPGESREEWERRLLKIVPLAEFFDLLGPFVGFAMVAALPPLAAAIWLKKLGVKEDARILAIAGISLAMLVLLVWSFARLWKSNSEFCRNAIRREMEELRKRDAERKAEQAEQELLREKRVRWDQLNGYEFEAATAEILRLHQFSPKLTKGSADGGIDIEVTRGGRKGVVQCKAHVACVGPHTVRDLFGVMHHSRSEFGIIVSLGGFTRGAVDFANNKPIFLVGASDLIAMQEGKDVLAERFTGALRTSTPTV